jgi:probable HAF family extracellular repeat protein
MCIKNSTKIPILLSRVSSDAENERYDMNKSRHFLIAYVGLAFLVACWLMGCSSGATDGGGSSSDNVTASRVAPPGDLGDIEDLGDLVGGGNWEYVKVYAIGENDYLVGQATGGGGQPALAAFLYDGAMNYIGIHGGVYDPADAGSGFIHSEAVDVNTAGEAIGNSITASSTDEDPQKRAFLYNGGFVDLYAAFAAADPVGTGTGLFSEAHYINDDYILLNVEDADDNINAFYYNIASGTFGSLGKIVGAELTEPVGININNQAVVNSEETTSVYHDLVTDSITSLNSLPGASETVSVAINNSDPGHVAGTSGDYAFFWDGGSMRSCGSLGGGSSSATDLNDNDRVVGHSTTASGATHAFFWTTSGGMTDLGTLGGTNSWATAINNNNLIVGYSETGATYSQGGVTQEVVHACAWYDGTIYDLGIHDDFYSYNFSEPIPFSEAVDVNDNNRIAGNSFSINLHYRGFYVDSSVP